MAPDQVTAVVVAWSGVGLVVIAAVGALVLKVLQNAKDIQAAWRQLRLHEQALNGHVEAARKVREP